MPVEDLVQGARDRVDVAKRRLRDLLELTRWLHS
jgi:hypothetical protein